MAPVAPLHLPSASWFPLVTALGILVGALAFAFGDYRRAIGGLVVTGLGAWLWSLEGPGHRLVSLTGDEGVGAGSP